MATANRITSPGTRRRRACFLAVLYARILRLRKSRNGHADQTDRNSRRQ